MKRLFLLLAALFLVYAIGVSYHLLPAINLGQVKPPVRQDDGQPLRVEEKTVVYEESVVIEAIEKALPSVVTIGITKTETSGGFFEINPFDPFTPFKRIPGQERQIERNIASGFIISSNGLIVTNKHVVSDRQASYKVLTDDDKEYQVIDISRDPLNDLAILKIDAKGLKPLKLGNSSSLKLGQLVIAIGTPLEFRNTVTAGIISGLGRGITAGSPFEGYVEQLDNVIQTDAAINPGNSGGPLINSSGEVIGVNTAVSAGSENIGFAIPINIVKDLIDNFKASGGKIERPFIGIRYQMIDKTTAVLNDLPEGAFIVEIIGGSPAKIAGLQKEDVIIEFDGRRIKGDDLTTLQKLIAEKKVGQRVSVKIFRDGQEKELTVTLGSFEE